ncbi:hypothetical protein [Brasilonema sp. UFV-L1]|uniref:hypothetical protein n=1 Tax=Brasilonema sp. UFV-L1 TaxID=2234130 RepID=UPI0030DD4F87
MTESVISYQLSERTQKSGIRSQEEMLDSLFLYSESRIADRRLCGEAALLVGFPDNRRL